MGWKSTIDITRSEALSIIENTDWEEISNEDLANIVEAVLGGENHGYNYTVTNDSLPKD